jgi:dihydrofolate reductase
MAKLIYSAITSLDGYIEDATGSFAWSVPDEEVHAFANECDRPIGTHLYGRRMYETMVYWETAGTGPGEPPFMRDYAEIWRAADKIVYSTTLRRVTTARTTLERRFDPEAVASLKATREVSIGGPTLAAHAFRAGLIDECHLLLSPVVVGGGLRALPEGVRVGLELVSERRFENGVVHLHYRTA